MNRAVGIGVFGSLCGVTFGLGTWQTKRYFWKQELIAERKAGLLQEPTDLFGDAAVDKFQRVKCDGYLACGESMLVGPRSSPAGRATGTAMAKSGYLVVTPFMDRTTRRFALVNRGWIARENVDEAFKPEEVPLEAKFQAVLVEGEKGGTFTPTNDKNDNFYFALDIEQLCKVRNLPTDSPLVECIGNPVGTDKILTKPLERFQDFKVLPITHVGYAATWYGLCLTGLYIMKKRFFR